MQECGRVGGLLGSNVVDQVRFDLGGSHLVPHTKCAAGPVNYDSRRVALYAPSFFRGNEGDDFMPSKHPDADNSQSLCP